MTISEAKNSLGVNLEESRQLRNAFYQSAIQLQLNILTFSRSHINTCSDLLHRSSDRIYACPQGPFI
jgi:hypothetical protein